MTLTATCQHLRGTLNCIFNPSFLSLFPNFGSASIVFWLWTMAQSSGLFLCSSSRVLPPPETHTFMRTRPFSAGLCTIFVSCCTVSQSSKPARKICGIMKPRKVSPEMEDLVCMLIKLINQQLKTEIQQSQFIKQLVCENLDDSSEGSAPPIGEGQRHDGHRHDNAIGIAESESQHGHHFDSLGSDELSKT